MKVFCLNCGCHFREDFEGTLKCGFWKMKGLQNLSTKFKKRIWNWIFSSPQDELAGATGYLLEFDWRAAPKRYEENEFAKEVPNYNKWPDEKRKQFQREYFKFIQLFNKKSMLHLFLKTHKKWTK